MLASPARALAAEVYIPDLVLGAPASDLFSWPAGVAVDSTGRIIVGDASHHQVKIFNRDGSFVAAIGEEWNEVQIYDYDASGNPVPPPGFSVLNSPGGFAFPTGIAVDRQDNLFVVDQVNHRVQVFDKNLSFVTAFGVYGADVFDDFGTIVSNAPLGALNFPQAVAIDPLNGTVWVADGFNNRVESFVKNPATGLYEGSAIVGSYGQEIGQLQQPQGVAIDSARHLVISDTFNHRVAIYDPTAPAGSQWRVFGATDADGHGIVGTGPGEFDAPGNLFVDSQDRIYVADVDNARVQVFDETGQYLFQLGVSNTPIMEVGYLIYPQAVAVDPGTGSIVVVDSGNQRIQTFRKAELTISNVAVTPATLPFGPDLITVSFTVTNTGAATLTNITPFVEPTDPSTATLSGGTAPYMSLSPGEQTTFHVTFATSGVGTTAFTTGVRGDHLASGAAHPQYVPATGPNTTDVVVTAALSPALAVGSIAASPPNVQPGQTIAATVGVQNVGNAELTSVLPQVTTSGVAVSATGLPPAPVSLSVGGSASFTFTYVAGSTYGWVSFSAAASGTHRTAGDTVAPPLDGAYVNVVSDNLAPSTLVSSEIQANGHLPVNGWYSSDVTLTLHATDNENGSGIRYVDYAYRTNTLITGRVQGDTAAVTITREGTTEVFFFATDNVANVEAQKSIKVFIDRGAPTVHYLPATTAPNAANWYRTPVMLPLTVADPWSGTASLQGGAAPISLSGPELVLAAEGTSVSASVLATDNAGNSAPYPSPAVNIDVTPPVIAATRTPMPNAAGWNNTPVLVSFAAGDPPPLVPCVALVAPACNPVPSGIVAVTPPILVTTEGANQVISGTAWDNAGNSASAIALVNIGGLQIPIRIDLTAPEGWNQFDVAAKDNFVFARDNLSGVPTTPLAPTSVVPARWSGEDDERGDEHGRDDERGDERGRDGARGDEHGRDGANAELRTYSIADLAGNTLTLVEKVKTDGHSIQVHVVSLQYSVGGVAGPVYRPDDATKKYEWSAGRDGSLKTLHQKLEIGDGHDRVQVEADYDAKKGKTSIRAIGPRPGAFVVKPGLVLLRMATQNGRLVIEY